MFRTSAALRSGRATGKCTTIVARVAEIAAISQHSKHDEAGDKSCIVHRCDNIRARSKLQLSFSVFDILHLA